MKRILYPTILFVLLELTLIFALVMWTVRSVLTRQEYEAVSRIARSTVKEMSFTGTATMVIGIVILALIMAGSTLLFVGWLRERIMHRKRAQFFQSFSHELMTPLTSLQMNADLLLEDQEHHRLTGPQVRQLVEDMRSQTRRLERRLRNIIETTRIENRKLALEKKVVDLGAWVGEFVARSSLISVTGQVRFSTELHGEGPHRAAVDERYLEIVLENLLENAVKNGARHVGISVRGTRDAVELAVSDDGGGIDPAAGPGIHFHQGPPAGGMGSSGKRQLDGGQAP